MFMYQQPRFWVGHSCRWGGRAPHAPVLAKRAVVFRIFSFLGLGMVPAPQQDAFPRTWSAWWSWSCCCKGRDVSQGQHCVALFSVPSVLQALYFYLPGPRDIFQGHAVPDVLVVPGSLWELVNTIHPGAFPSHFPILIQRFQILLVWL